MGVLIRKEKGVFVFTKIARLAIILLIISLAYALVDTIWAIYMNSLIDNLVFISFLSALFSVVAVVSYFLLIPIVEKKSKSRLFALSLFFIAITYSLFAINPNLYIFILLAFILIFLTSLRITTFGIIVRDKSSKKQFSRNEGLMYTFFNIAWVIGPLIAGYVSQAYGIPLIFLLSGFFILIAFFLFKISRINDANINKRADEGVLKNFFNFFKNKNRVSAYIMGGGINFWLTLIFLYMPIFIIKHGLNDLWVGYFLFAIGVPTVLFEYPASKLAGRIGFKKIFKIGFFILFTTAFICFFLENVYLIMGFLVLSGFGMAMLEPTTEAYFFDILKTKREENKYYGPYNTTIDVSHFVGRVLAGIMLVFLPFKFIFLLFGFFMFLYFLFCSKIKEVKERLRR